MSACHCECAVHEGAEKHAFGKMFFYKMRSCEYVFDFLNGAQELRRSAFLRARKWALGEDPRSSHGCPS